MFRILIGGYYGFDNLGDEAVLAGLIKGLREKLPGVEIAALSANPDKTRLLHGITSIKRTDFISIFTLMRKSDIFLFGGGSLIQDITSMMSPLYYFGLLTMSRLAKLPYMLIAQGVGPLNRNFIKKLTAHNFNGAKLITVRDKKSAELLKDIGVKKDIQVTADLALLLEPNQSPRVQNWINKNIPSDKKIVCVSIRPWISDSTIAINQVVEAINQDTSIFPIYLPMQPDVDSDLSISMLKETGGALIDFAPTPSEVLAIISNCHYTIAMRLHTLILSVLVGIPAFGIIYDPKVNDFAKKANIEAADIDNNLFKSLMSFLDSIPRHSEKKESMIIDANKNINLITEFLIKEKQ
jgi:polysaccharide pyruvyl transferase CsaB